MPKATPDQVIVHRLELQQTERDALEAALAGRFVTNAVSGLGDVLTGFGNLLKPFEGVLTAIGALWIADRTLDEIKEYLLDDDELTDKERFDLYYEEHRREQRKKERRSEQRTEGRAQ